MTQKAKAQRERKSECVQRRMITCDPPLSSPILATEIGGRGESRINSFQNPHGNRTFSASPTWLPYLIHRIHPRYAPPCVAVYGASIAAVRQVINHISNYSAGDSLRDDMLYENVRGRGGGGDQIETNTPRLFRYRRKAGLLAPPPATIGAFYLNNLTTAKGGSRVTMRTGIATHTEARFL